MPGAARMKQAASLLSRALPNNRFARSVSVLVGGTVGAQLIMVLAAPVLTRLYPPQDFGLLAVFAALLSLGAVVASLRYEVAIPLPHDQKEAAALLVLSLSALVAFVALVAIPVLLYRDELARLLNTPRLADYLYLVPLGILVAGAYNVLNYWAIRMQAFTPLAKTRLSQSLVAACIQLGGAPLGPLALLLGHVAGQASGLFSLGVRLVYRRWPEAGSAGWSDVVVVAKRYRKFPLFSTWGALFNTAGSQLPPILFAALFGPAIAGVYALANRVLSMPMQILGQAIANVFLSSAAGAHREGRLAVLVADIHRKLADIGMPPMLLLLIAGPEIFRQVFGPQWREAGVFAQWMAPWLYLVFIASPLTSLFEVLDRQATGMIFQCALLVVRVAAIGAGAAIGDVMSAVALFALGSAACWLVNLAWIVRASGNGWKQIWHPSVGALGWSVALASPVVLSATWHPAGTFLVVALVAAAALIAARYTYLMKNAWL
jgi:O-antigen/teichoic acid export membrane protein